MQFKNTHYNKNYKIQKKNIALLKNLNLASELLGALICGRALDPKIKGKVQLDVMYVLYLVLHRQRTFNYSKEPL